VYAALIPKLETAMALVPVLIIPFMLLGGFFIPNLPSFLNWAKYLSIFFYAFNACLILEFSGDQIFYCDGSHSILICSAHPGTVTFTGDEFLTYLSVSYGLELYLLSLIGIIVGFRVMAYFALRFVKTDLEGRQ